MSNDNIASGPDIKDRRRYRRVEMTIPARLMLPDGSEYECSTLDISTSSVALRTSKAVEIGQHVMVELDGIVAEGTVATMRPNCLVLNLNLDAKKRGRLAQRIDIFNARPLANASQREA